MIQTDFFESLLERVKRRPQRPRPPQKLPGATDQFEFNSYPVRVLRRPYQRSLGVIIKPSGMIRVTAGKSTSARTIWQFLRECEDWIIKTQKEYDKLREKYPPKKYQENEMFPFLGRAHALKFLKHNKKHHKLIINDDTLNFFVGTKGLGSAADIKKEVHKFYETQGRKILQDRVEEYSKEMELYPKKLSFRAQKTRWGSCGSNGHISLNWKLVAAHLDIIDYVVVHELAHLKHQNHGPQFWRLVKSHSPGYKFHKRWLAHNQYEFDFLAKKPELYFYKD